MSKYCSNCGNEMKQDETFCSKCGKSIDTASKEEKGKKGASIAGFVFSIIGILTCGLTSLIGLIISIIGLCISKNKKRKDSLAVAGIIISSIIIGLWIVAIIYGFATAKEIVVEDFSTMSYKEAVDYCDRSILNCTFSKKYSETVPSGQYIEQSIKAGTKIKSYEIVNIVYSQGIIEESIEKTTENNSTKKEESKTTSTNNKQLNKIKNTNLKNNFIKACEEIKMDASKIKSVKKVDDWNSGPRYTFTYKNTQFILYAYDDGGVSSITIANNNLDKIYLEGYEPYNVNDYLLDAGIIGELQIATEKSVKNVLNHPDTAKFHWFTSGAYFKNKDIYVVTGKFDAKNSFGIEKTSSFYIEMKMIEGSYSTVYMTVDKEKYVGTESNIAKNERKEIPEQLNDTNQETTTIITLKEGQKGTYGREDKFDGETYIRYYIPAGKYEVVAKTKNAHFFIESVAIHKEGGYDVSDEIRNVKFSNVGDKEIIEITSDQCIMLVMYTKIQLTKIG